jgi:hypothetical protein
MAIIGQPITALAIYGAVGMPYPRPIVIPVDFALQVAGLLQPIGFVVTQNFCQVANAGIQIIVEVLDDQLNALNLYGATGLVLAFQKPDGVQFTKTAQYLTNGIDGKIYYITTATDFLEAGLWYIQAQVIIGGSVLTTLWGQFEVNANL